MDEMLKRRLVGASVLLGGALLLSVLLPDPDTPAELEPGQQRVTVNLNETASPVPEAGTEAFSRSAAVATGEPPAESVPATVAEPAAEAEPVSEPDLESRALPPAAESSAPAATAAPAAGPRLKLDTELSKPAAKPALPAKPAKPETAAPESGMQKAETVPAPRTAPAPTTSEKPWYVQIGSFGEVANAHQLLDRLKPAGYSGLISPAETASGTRYRARVGPYVSREQAEAARGRLAQSGVSGATIVQE